MVHDTGGVVKMTTNCTAESDTDTYEVYDFPSSLTNPMAKVTKIVIDNRTGVDTHVWLDDNETSGTAMGNPPKFPVVHVGAERTVILDEDDLDGWIITNGILAGVNDGATGNGVHIRAEVEILR